MQSHGPVLDRFQHVSKQDSRAARGAAAKWQQRFVLSRKAGVARWTRKYLPQLLFWSTSKWSGLEKDARMSVSELEKCKPACVQDSNRTLIADGINEVCFILP